VLCRYQSEAQDALREISGFMARLKLELHPEKTRLVRMENEGFDFLGFYFRKTMELVVRDLNPVIRGWITREKFKRWYAGCGIEYFFKQGIIGT